MVLQWFLVCFCIGLPPSATSFNHEVTACLLLCNFSDTLSYLETFHCWTTIIRTQMMSYRHSAFKVTARHANLQYYLRKPTICFFSQTLLIAITNKITTRFHCFVYRSDVSLYKPSALIFPTIAWLSRKKVPTNLLLQSNNKAVCNYTRTLN